MAGVGGIAHTRGDNFHARISLGALSPQGAQMMWEAPHVGVAVPMIKGRGTAISPDEQPVEFQAYWTPDPHPRKLRPGSSDEVLLQSVRPQEIGGRNSRSCRRPRRTSGRRRVSTWLGPQRP